MEIGNKIGCRDWVNYFISLESWPTRVTGKTISSQVKEHYITKLHNYYSILSTVVILMKWMNFGLNIKVNIIINFRLIFIGSKKWKRHIIFF
jgi:hypothetical protein